MFHKRKMVVYRKIPMVKYNTATESNYKDTL